MEIDLLNDIGLGFIKLWFLLALTHFLLTRSRNTSAGTLHALVLLVLSGVACVPVLERTLPGLHLRILPTEFIATVQWSYEGVASGTFTFIASAYLMVVALLLTRRLLQIRQIFVLVKKSRSLAIEVHRNCAEQIRSQLEIKRPVQLRYSDHISSPLTIGVLQPWVILPRESLLWDEHRLRRILLHELAHVARFDWATKQLGYCLVTFFWAVPAAWRVLEKMEWLAELACDDIVIAAEGRRSDYAHDLLDLTASRAFAGAVGLTESYNHYDRLAAVLDGARIRQQSPFKFCVHGAVFLMLLFLIAGVRLTEKSVTPTADSFVLRPLVILEQTSDERVVTELPEEGAVLTIDKGLTSGQINPPLGVPEMDKKFHVYPVLEQNWRDTASAAMPIAQPLIKVLPEYPRKALRRARVRV